MLGRSAHRLACSKVCSRQLSYFGVDSRSPASNLFEMAMDDSAHLRAFSTVPGASALEKELNMYANKKQTPVSLKSLMETGQGDHLNKFDEFMKDKYAKEKPQVNDRILIQVACFLHRELPIRLAQRAQKLEGSPVFQRSESVREVVSWYKTSFQELRAAAVPLDTQKESQFARLCESIYERHSATLITMAKGAHEIRTIMKQDVASFADYDDVQKRLDEFYMSRIGIRMLIGQYLALRACSLDRNMIGLINLRASPFDIAAQAIRDAAHICTRVHGDAPEVSIHGRLDLTFPYVCSHISYVLLELLKNSMRATVETHGLDNMPPIKVVIADGEDNEDLVIKVSDEGGGIKRSNMHRVFSYLYTTADPSVISQMLATKSEDDLKDFSTTSPLAGLGYGLPIARCYARCFEGDLVLMSMEGYGTDSFIYLPRLGTKNTAV